ncbi:MAG TPA: acyltransferase family protein [Nocardioidaceae bacterium]
MPWSYRPALDGLRTVAVYLVLLFHTGLAAAGGGFIGVDLFFVLSGFLVSNVILSEIDRTGTLRLGRFYARRVRRLLPAAVVVVAATSAVFVLVSSLPRRLPLVGDAQSALLYVANWRFLFSAEDYFAADVEESPFLHFWSLAIEEQFYVVFPILLLLLSRATRRWGWAMLAGLGAFFVLSLGSQLYWAQVDANHAYYGTDARLYQLLAGALLAVALRTWQVSVRRRTAEVLAVGGLVAMLLLGSGLLAMTPSWRGIAATAASAALITGLGLREEGLLAGVLSRPVPVFLGRISYGTYLWHWPVILVLEEVLVVGPTVVAVLALAVSTGLAAVSYEVLEMPIRKAQPLNRFTWHTATVGVATSALVAVSLVPWLLEQDRRPALAGLSAATGAPAVAPTEGETELPDDVDWESVSSDVGAVGSCSADDIDDCTVVEGSGPHLLVVGDSQAQMLEPMFERIAQERDLTLSVNIVQGCPWQEGLMHAGVRRSAEACERGRVGWYDEVLPELDPDVVLFMARPRDEASWEDVLVRRDGKDQPLAEAIAETSQETLDKVTGIGARALVVERLIMPESFDPPECLSSAADPSDCAVPVPLGTSPTDAFMVATAAREPDVFTIDLNPAFCPTAPMCQPVVDDHIVWRDDHHVTAKFAEARWKQVWKLIEKSGALSESS